MKVPFVDLVKQHKSTGLDYVFGNLLLEAVEEADFIGGEHVMKFEKEFASFCHVKYCVSVGSGTDALRLALMAADVGVGDIVVTVPNTFIATTEAITQTGATPAFVDIDSRSYNMNPLRLEDYLSKTRIEKVKAIIPVHMYGRPAFMDAILEIAGRYDIAVIEDACQAHGAAIYSRDKGTWVRAGSMGLAGAFSFYPTKNLGALGDAGAVTTNSLKIAAKVIMLRDHGQTTKYTHPIEGYNSRMDAIQAAFLRAKLNYLNQWNELRRGRARVYNNLLQGIQRLTLPQVSGNRSVYHLYVVRHPTRPALVQYLTEKGVGTGIHYPKPLHLVPAYERLAYKRGDFPVAEKVCSEVISLPMYPELTFMQQCYVAECIEDFTKEFTNG